MRAVILYPWEYPENRGVFQLASLLRRLDIEVDIVSSTISPRKKNNHDDGVNLFCVNEHPNAVSKIGFMAFPHFNIWRNALSKLSAERKWDFVFVRESLLANTAWRMGKQNSIPVFLDMRENRPEMLKTQFTRAPLKWLLPFYLFMLGAHERQFLNKMTHIFTVSGKLKEWTHHTYAVPVERISVLSNYPSSQILEAAEKYRKGGEAEADDDVLKLVFAGSVTQTRGLQYILPAIKILLDNREKVTLCIIGNGSYLNELKTMTCCLKLEDTVSFEAPVDPAILMETLSKFHVGLIPYDVNPHTNVTIPGKLFEYMAIGLPVLSSPRQTVVDILNETRCGLYYQTYDPKEIAEKIKQMSDPALRSQMGHVAVEAIRTRYNEDTNVHCLKTVLKQSMSFS